MSDCLQHLIVLQLYRLIRGIGRQRLVRTRKIQNNTLLALQRLTSSPLQTIQNVTFVLHNSLLLFTLARSVTHYDPLIEGSGL